MAENRSVLKYHLTVTGIFGRNRKPKSQIVPLSGIAEYTDPSAPIDPLTIETAVASALKSINAQPGLSWRVCECPITLMTFTDKYGTHTMESFMLYSDRVVCSGIVAGKD